MELQRVNLSKQTNDRDLPNTIHKSHDMSSSNGNLSFQSHEHSYSFTEAMNSKDVVGSSESSDPIYDSVNVSVFSPFVEEGSEVKKIGDMEGVFYMRTKTSINRRRSFLRTPDSGIVRKKDKADLSDTQWKRRYMRLSNNIVADTTSPEHLRTYSGHASFMDTVGTVNLSLDGTLGTINSENNSNSNQLSESGTLLTEMQGHSVVDVDAVLDIHDVKCNFEVGNFTIGKKLMTIPLKMINFIKRDALEKKLALDFPREGYREYKCGEILLSLFYNLEEVVGSPQQLIRANDTGLSTSGVDNCEKEALIHPSQQEIEIVVNSTKERDMWYDRISSFILRAELDELKTNVKPVPFIFKSKKPYQCIQHCVAEYVWHFIYGTKRGKDFGKGIVLLRAPGEGLVMTMIDKTEYKRRLQCLRLGEIIIASVDEQTINCVEVNISDSRVYVSDPFSCEFFIELSTSAAASCMLHQKHIIPPLIEFEKQRIIAFKALSIYDRDRNVEWLIKVKRCSITYPYQLSDEDRFSFLPFGHANEPVKVNEEIFIEDTIKDSKKEDKPVEEKNIIVRGVHDKAPRENLGLFNLLGPSLAVRNCVDTKVSTDVGDNDKDSCHRCTSDLLSTNLIHLYPSLVVKQETRRYFDPSITCQSPMSDTVMKHSDNESITDEIREHLHPDVKAILSPTMTPIEMVSDISYPLRSEAKVLHAKIGDPPPPPGDDYFINMVVSLDFSTGHFYGVDNKDSTVAISIPVTKITCVTAFSQVFGSMGFTIHCLPDDVEICIIPEEVTDIAKWIFLFSSLSVHCVNNLSREEINKEHQNKMSHEAGKLCAFQGPSEANSNATMYECGLCEMKKYVCDVTKTFHPDALLRISTIHHYQQRIMSERLKAELDADFTILDSDETRNVKPDVGSNLPTLGKWILSSLAPLDVKPPESFYDIECIISKSNAFIENERKFWKSSNQ